MPPEMRGTSSLPLPGRAARFLAGWSVAHPRALAALLAAVTAVLGAGALRLTVESSFSSFLDEDHPFLRTTNEVVGAFGTHLPLLVVLDAGRPITREDVARTRGFFEGLAFLPYVDRVAHPGNTSVVRGAGDTLEIASFADAVLGEERTGDLAYSLLGRRGESLAAAVYVRYVAGRDDEDAAEVMAALQAYLEETPPPEGYEVRTAGLVGLYSEIARRIRHDVLWFVLLGGLVTAAFLLYTYRRLSGVAAPLGLVALTLIWTLGGMGWAGLNLTVSMTLLPPLAMVVGVADAIHYLNHVARARAADPEAPVSTWVVSAAARVGLPCLLTSVTTMVGFVSLYTSEIRPIRQFGLASAAAIGVALLLTFTAVPLLLAWFPPEPSRDRSRPGDAVSLVLAACARLLRRPRLLLLGWACVCGGSGVLLSQVRVETGFAELFPADDPFAANLRWVERRFWGTDVLGLRWTAPPQGVRLLDPEVLAPLLEVVRRLEGTDNVAAVSGTPTFLRDLRAAVLADGGAEAAVWTRPLAAQLHLLLEQADPGLLERFETDDHDQAILVVQVGLVGARALRELVERVEGHLAAVPVPGRIDLFGPVYMFQRLVFTVVRSLVVSFGLALLLVWLAVSLGLGSLRLGTIGMVPNVVPILVTGGLMGLLAVSLNDNTVMVASIGIGIGVDDTIHLLVAWRRARADGVGPEEAVRRALAEVGPAIVATSLVLLCGFAVGLSSSFRPPRTFAGLAAALVAVALLSDLLLMTVLLARARRS